MAVDLLGIASTNAVTARPTDTRVFNTSDTFFKNCSSPTAQDGTYFDAAWFNGIMQQIRRAIRGMGIVENNADDDMLLKAIQAAMGTSINLTQFARTIPLYPGVRTATGRFTSTQGTGSLVLDPAVEWVHRGYFIYNTSSFLLADRTFATAANKTYHLRWYAPGLTLAPVGTYPNGRFMLRDVSDVAYNPGGFPETDAQLDGFFDDMLLARVVTNGANALTVTHLTNLPFLAADTGIAWSNVQNADGAGYLYVKPPAGATTNWSRSPNRGGAGVLTYSSPSNGGLQPHTEFFTTSGGLVPQFDRYGTNPVFVTRGYSAGATVTATIEMTVSLQGRQ